MQHPPSTLDAYNSKHSSRTQQRSYESPKKEAAKHYYVLDTSAAHGQLSKQSLGSHLSKSTANVAQPQAPRHRKAIQEDTYQPIVKAIEIKQGKLFVETAPMPSRKPTQESSSSVRRTSSNESSSSSSLHRRPRVQKRPSFGSTFVEVTKEDPERSRSKAEQLAAAAPKSHGRGSDYMYISDEQLKQQRAQRGAGDYTTLPKKSGHQHQHSRQSSDGSYHSQQAMSDTQQQLSSQDIYGRRIPIRTVSKSESGRYIDPSADDGMSIDIDRASDLNSSLYSDPVGSSPSASQVAAMKKPKSILKKPKSKEQQLTRNKSSDFIFSYENPTILATFDAAEDLTVSTRPKKEASIPTFEEENLKAKMTRYFSYDELSTVGLGASNEAAEEAATAFRHHAKTPSNSVSDSGVSSLATPRTNTSGAAPASAAAVDESVSADMTDQQTAPAATVYIRVTVPEVNRQKCMQFQLSDSIHLAKQAVLLELGGDLKDPWNYGLYCPPTSGKAGKFLQDERPMKDYPLAGPIGYLELKYKRRIYRTQAVNAAKLKKLHTRSCLKQFLDYVRQNDTARVNKWVNKGLDPNFHCKDSGETPLTTAVSLPKPRAMIMALCAGGAHLDFRESKEAMTPLHKAAIYGNLEAIITLLDLGQSPNCVDPRGLTPLYNTTVHDTRANCAERLLYDHSILGVCDDQGLQEIHQACKFGRLQHLQCLINYGADLNATTKNGNTPLHICGFMNQTECAKLLLFRGAGRARPNLQDQTAYQVAVVACHEAVAEVIRDFNDDEARPIRDAPKFNTGRRSSIPTLRNQRWGSMSNLGGGPDSQGGAQTQMMMRRMQLGQSSVPATLGAAASESVGCLVSAANAEGASFGLGLPRRGLALELQAVRPLSSTPAPSQQQLLADDQQPVSHSNRTVVLQRGPRGFGFVLRGAKAGSNASPTGAVPEFRPSSLIPGLQYLEEVEAGSPAYRAGLRSGDYILAINDTDVRSASHETCVRLIKESPGEILALQVVTVMKKAPASDRRASMTSSRVSVDQADQDAVSLSGSSTTDAQSQSGGGGVNFPYRLATVHSPKTLTQQQQQQQVQPSPPNHQPPSISAAPKIYEDEADIRRKLHQNLSSSGGSATSGSTGTAAASSSSVRGVSSFFNSSSSGQQQRALKPAAPPPPTRAVPIASAAAAAAT
uniref:PDZ domain-containing protein n=1 Tax=Macrostomum lignano TaxID=282301 RepID=A0A1I8HXG5_9PLAT